MADDAGDEGVEHPLEHAYCWSVASFSWLTPLARKAVSGTLQADDVWKAPAGESVDDAMQLFKMAWEVEKQQKTPSVARAMLRANARRVVWSSCLLLIFMCTQLVQPLLIQSLIDVLNDRSAGASGWLLASALLVSSLASSMLISEFFRHSFILGILWRTAATGAIYEKAINMSARAQSEGSTGQTTNLMSVDAEKFVLAAQCFQFLWMSPLMMFLCGIVMAYRIGYVGFLGLAFLFMTVPVQHIIAKRGAQVRVNALAFTDQRMKFVTEAVQGIRVAKLYAWEKIIYKHVASLRLRECAKLCSCLFIKIVVREGLLLIAPAIALMMILAAKIWQDGEVELSLAVMALGLINTLRFPLTLLTLAFSSSQDGFVAATRISKFLLREDGHRPIECPEKGDAYAVAVREAVCCWDPVQPFRLRVPWCQLPWGSKVAVLGPVGSGKTSFLSMLLGEMETLEGSFSLKGRVAYMAQSPWIQNTTLRMNILFGLPMDEVIYDQVLDAVALQPDLEALLDGDLTDIGERGINLSGGQKARVGLARCLYAASAGSADVVVLDSPFAALDPLTAQTVVEGLMRMTAGCTVVCAMSSHTHLLPNFEKFLVLNDGMLLAGSEDLSPELSNSHNSWRISPKPSEGKPVTRMSSRAPPSAPRRLMQADVGTKAFPLTALAKWLGGSRELHGFLIGFPISVIFVLGQGCRVLADVTVTHWAAGETDFSTPPLFLCFLALLLGLRVALSTLASFRAARLLHNAMFWRLLRAPVTTYFDVVTSGEICNKFSKDLEIADVQLPDFLVALLSHFAQLLLILGLTIFAVPGFAIVLCLLSAVFVMIGIRSGCLLRALQSWESSSRSPIYSSFSETLSGLQTIRAWGLQDRFCELQKQILRRNMRFFHAASMTDLWLMYRVELLSAAIIGSFSFLAVFLRQSVDGNTVGVALVYAVQLTSMFQRTTKLAITVGQMLTACERVLAFEKIPQEPELLSSRSLPQGWPNKGAIRFENVSVRYRDGDLVLKNVTFSVDAGARVGVCGRSGAGKSSLIMALFRVIDPVAGSITIDGVSIAEIGLQTLRQNLVIIPQEPTVFSGSLRFNLDPSGGIADSVLVGALQQVGLDGLVADAGLEMTIAEQGGNLSQGQRQLLCIARAFVREARIMILDEATSSIDEQTDSLIKTTLQEHWSKGHRNCTVLTVAHRLSTILDYDRILVLSRGEVMEFGTPEELLSKPEGHFAQMAKEVTPAQTKASL